MELATAMKKKTFQDEIKESFIAIKKYELERRHANNVKLALILDFSDLTANYFGKSEPNICDGHNEHFKDETKLAMTRKLIT